jgi:polyhydroxybutyrate depolymerase
MHILEVRADESRRSATSPRSARRRDSEEGQNKVIGRQLSLALVVILIGVACDALPGAPKAAAPRATPAPTTAMAIPQERRMVSDGLDRTYWIFVPEALDRSKPAALVLWLHGTGEKVPGEDWRSSGLGTLAQQRGFVVVFPQAAGYSRQWNAGLCCGDASTTGIDDVAFVARIIDAVATEVPIDADRVYVGGFSMGGTMANRLACDLADRFAAIATVPGTFYASSCRPSRPVSVIALHGTADTSMPYEGGNGLPTSPNPEMVQPSVESVLGDWRERFACATPTVERAPPVTKTTARCRGGADVVLYRADGGDHRQPLSSVTSGSRATTEVPLVLDFFFAHRRSGAP